MKFKRLTGIFYPKNEKFITKKILRYKKSISFFVIQLFFSQQIETYFFGNQFDDKQ